MKLKKFISFLLSAILLCSVFSPAVLAVQKNEYPIILVLGRGPNTPYYGDDGKQIFPIKLSTDELTEKVEECLPYLAMGLATGDLKPWAKKVGEVIKPIYADMIPGEDGKLNGGPKKLNGYGYPLSPADSTSAYDYVFNYDWRRDTAESAAFLDEYIQQIKEKEKCEKVSIVGRCYGANVIAEYLYDFGHGDIDTAVFYCSTALGCYASGCIFGGNIKVKPAELEAFLENNEIIGDEVITEFIRSTVSFINIFSGFDGVTDFVNSFIETVFPVLAPEIFPISYGSMSCFWNMVDMSHYENAKKIIYNGQKEKYSDFIEKIDRYHYDVMANLPEMLTRYAQEGLNVGVVAKYGRDALYPIFDNGDPQSDDTVELSRSSFGATCSRLGRVLSNEYLSSADMKYVSSDLCVDSSTALFKDSTWFIKGAEHSDFPYSIDFLITAICNFDGQLTVSDSVEYPQFLKYNSETQTLSPLTDKPESRTEGENFMVRLLRFIVSFIEIFKSLFKL